MSFDGWVVMSLVFSEAISVGKRLIAYEMSFEILFAKQLLLEI